MTYITNELEKATKYKSVKDAINRDYFSIVLDNNIWYIESRGCPAMVYDRVVKEGKRIFSNYTYIGDLRRV